MSNLGGNVIHEGLVPSSIVVGGIGGDLPDVVLDGNHEPFLPVFERQERFGFPSQNCVQFSLLNVLETTAKRLGRTLNLSDRFLYWASGCTERGNTFGNGYHGLKGHGAPSEALWPWLVAMSREVYGQEPPADVKAEAMKLFDEWEIGTLRYVTPTIENLKKALKKGAVWFCNDGHAMMIYRIDDRIRVFDTYPGMSGDGKGSFPLEYIPQIVAAYLVPFNLKPLNPQPMPTLVLPENCYVTGVFPTELKTALHVGGKLIIYESEGKLLSQWVARNENQTTHRFDGGSTRTISEKDWNGFPHVNPKLEPLP